MDDDTMAEDVLLGGLPYRVRMRGGERADALFQEGLQTFREGANGSGAASLFHAAAGLGHVEALVWYGDCLRRGRGIERAGAAAYACYIRAAEAGSGGGRAGIAACLLGGIGVARDESEGRKLSRELAQAGVSAGMVCEGDSLQVRVVQEDPREGISWFRRGAEPGNGEAMLRLGRAYVTGMGVTTDVPAAKEWFARGAGVGEAEAMWELGRLAEGDDGRMALGPAVCWVRKAS
jgi:TPR repeat protein